jgi:predicted transcriptional regulator
VPFRKKVQVSLTEDQHARLKSLAEKRDVSVSDLIRQAIEQVYIGDLERDLGARDVQRLGEARLVIAEEEEEIGIKGPEVLAGRTGVDIGA